MGVFSPDNPRRRDRQTETERLSERERREREFLDFQVPSTARGHLMMNHTSIIILRQFETQSQNCMEMTGSQFCKRKYRHIYRERVYSYTIHTNIQRDKQIRRLVLGERHREREKTKTQ